METTTFILIDKNGNTAHELVVKEPIRNVMHVGLVTHDSRYFVLDHKVHGRDALVFNETDLYAA